MHIEQESFWCIILLNGKNQHYYVVLSCIYVLMGKINTIMSFSRVYIGHRRKVWERYLLYGRDQAEGFILISAFVWELKGIVTGNKCCPMKCVVDVKVKRALCWWKCDGNDRNVLWMYVKVNRALSSVLIEMIEMFIGCQGKASSVLMEMIEMWWKCVVEIMATRALFWWKCDENIRNYTVGGWIIDNCCVATGVVERRDVS